MLRKATVLFWIILIGLPTMLMAAMPNMISHQGRIADSAGDAYTAGNYDFKFTICEPSDNNMIGTAAWPSSDVAS